MNKSIGDRIYSLRKKLGLSQEEFARRIGVSRQVVSKWEMNQVIPLTDKLKKISEEFNISYDEIFGDKDSIKRNNIIRYILIFLGIIIVEVIIILIHTYILDKKDMEYRCIGTKTYYVDKIYDSDDDNYKYVILIDGNNQVNNVKVKNVIINNIEVGNSYEFVYRSNDVENSIDEIINDKIVNIIKSNKSREDYVEINSCK
jgi:putative DNA-binding protein